MADVSINLNDLDDMKRLTESSSKVQIVAAQPKTLSHLPQRPAVDLAFVNLNYRVKEGRSHSECNFFNMNLNSCITVELTCSLFCVIIFKS